MTLQQIFDRVAKENSHSKAKHGMWKDLMLEGCHKGAISREWAHHRALTGEIKEWYKAFQGGDTHGEHGEVAELLQIMNCCARRVMFLTGEPDA